MKKLLSIFTTFSILVTPITWVNGCSPVLDLPYISNNKISKNAQKTINKVVLENEKNSQIKSLFDYNLDEWTNPSFTPVKNIMEIKFDLNSLFYQTSQYLRMQKNMPTNQITKKDSLEYIKASLLSSSNLISQPWATVVEKYNWYLNQKNKDQTVLDLGKVVNYFDGNTWNDNLYNQKRWLYVDQIRSNDPKDWFRDAHAWTLNPNSEDYNQDTKFDQGIFYHVLLNNFLEAVGTKYYVNLKTIWNENNSQHPLSPEIAGITLAFTTWDSKKWTKHFVDNRPIVDSNNNIFENLPILPLEQKIGVKLVVADIYGKISNYIIGNFVLSGLLNLQHDL
ncbi:hypothetical protein [Spiroplasma endosymbiont of Stenodema calcarata]|uniref:hypothetical protein n=1 Tax=Spiroplasma endosymbiont of Stenodema calcarata TaxID=3139328 RepID=UPI003CCAE74C